MKVESKDFAGSLCGCVYEKELQQSFYDRMVFYIDGKLLFERYIHGEAAGLVVRMWGSGFDEEGEILWESEPKYDNLKAALPKKLTAIYDEGNALQFDDSYMRFVKVEEIKTDAENGYGFFKVLRLRRKK